MASDGALLTRFNPRTRVGCDRLSGRKGQHRYPVSIHAPAWGATVADSPCGPRRSMFQSTHPRGVRRDLAPVIVQQHPVSIHAPAWGATPQRQLYLSPRHWFQSTHPRGVRRAAGRQTRHEGIRFNPRTRVGCDYQPASFRVQAEAFQSTHPRGVRLAIDAENLIRFDRVSIHAPAWGATDRPELRLSWFRCFNPRTRVGCDPYEGKDGRFYWSFQSTHPRGVRRVPGALLNDCTIPVSIHAPAWGATVSMFYPVDSRD